MAILLKHDTFLTKVTLSCIFLGVFLFELRSQKLNLAWPWFLTFFRFQNPHPPSASQQSKKPSISGVDKVGGRTRTKRNKRWYGKKCLRAAEKRMLLRFFGALPNNTHINFFCFSYTPFFDEFIFRPSSLRTNYIFKHLSNFV